MEIKFTWSPTLSVYDERLDAQHQQLLESVNRLLDSVSQGKVDIVVVKQTLEFLDYYTTTHLADEEAYMQEHQYPHLEEHRAIHNKFIESYQDMKSRILSFADPEKLMFDLENNLARWWVDHIGKEDKKYADFIRNHQK